MQVLPHLKTWMDYFSISLLYENNSDDGDHNKFSTFRFFHTQTSYYLATFVCVLQKTSV